MARSVEKLLEKRSMSGCGTVLVLLLVVLAVCAISSDAEKMSEYKKVTIKVLQRAAREKKQEAEPDRPRAPEGPRGESRVRNVRRILDQAAPQAPARRSAVALPQQTARTLTADISAEAGQRQGAATRALSERLQGLAGSTSQIGSGGSRGWKPGAVQTERGGGAGGGGAGGGGTGGGIQSDRGAGGGGSGLFAGGSGSGTQIKLAPGRPLKQRIDDTEFDDLAAWLRKNRVDFCDNVRSRMGTRPWPEDLTAIQPFKVVEPGRETLYVLYIQLGPASRTLKVLLVDQSLKASMIVDQRQDRVQQYKSGYVTEERGTCLGLIDVTDAQAAAPEAKRALEVFTAWREQVVGKRG